MANLSLYLDQVPGKGRGVFCADDLAADLVIETAPVIVMEAKDRVHLDQTRLHDYIFTWGAKQDQCAMALGWIPLFNHSYTANCEYFMDYEDEVMYIKTVRAVPAGEELTINYNGDWNDPKPIWFDAKT